MKLPFLSMFGAYARLVIFAAGLLLGIQVPAFVDQYKNRVAAHYLEVSANIAGFQATANELFEGNLQALVAYYRNSTDPVFSRDANSLQTVVARYERISAEHAAMQQHPIRVAAHIAIAADQEFLRETFDAYGYTVPLNLVAVGWGMALAVLLIVFIDCCWFGCKRCAQWLGKPRHRHTEQVRS
ncbi:MAG: DUF2937 family protein [Gammaproteobacteria bacterium]